MNAFEEIISLMRLEGSSYNPKSIQLAVMESYNTCTVNGLKLESDDLLFMEYLVTGYHKAVNFTSPQVKNQDTFVKPLEKGDTVAIYQISDEKYIVLGRLVSA